MEYKELEKESLTLDNLTKQINKNLEHEWENICKEIESYADEKRKRTFVKGTKSKLKLIKCANIIVKTFAIVI